LEFLLFYQLLYQTYRSSLYESNFLNPFIAYLPCFAFMQRPLKSYDQNKRRFLVKHGDDSVFAKMDLSDLKKVLDYLG
ncbi:hypothetical protein, partial [Candidatus Bandiella numerosa]|uniref:hypothetical protein n=1 Tax=Candidatus Bandiella numerosa TaxID=2570586 RepID=UPI001F15738E